MATVRQALALQDKMSPVLSRIMKSMSTTIDIMEQMNTASSRGLDSGAFNRARRDIDAAAHALEDLNREQQQLPAQQERVRRGFADWQAAIVTVNQGIQLIGSAMQAVGKVTTFADSMTNTSSRLSLINDGTQTQLELQQKIFESAQRSRAAYDDTADAVARLNLLAGKVFTSNDEAIKFSEIMNKAFTISGADTSEQSAAMRQMSQALASGRLQGDEFNSILENAPMIAQAIENYVGVSRAELRKMATEGKITSDIIKAAVFSAADDIEGKFQDMPRTFAQTATSFKNIMQQKLRPEIERLNKFLNSAQFQNFFLDMVTVAGVAINMLSGIISLVVSIGQAISDNWSFIEPFVWGIAGVIGAFTTALIINAAVQGATMVATYLKAAAEWASTTATWAATAAQYGLNTAMYACPVVWIIVLIFALIAAMVALWDNCAGLRRFVADWWAESAKLAGRLYNNVIVPLVNAVFEANRKIIAGTTSFAKDMINKYADLAIGVVDSFDFITAAVRKMLETYNSVASFFGHQTIDVDFITSAKGIDATRNSMLKKLDAYSAAAQNEFQPIQEMNLAAWDNTMDNFSDKIADFKIMDFAKGALKDALGLEDAAAKAASAFDPETMASNWGANVPSYEDLLKGVGSDVGAIADSTAISEEDLRYLRDIAEVDYINQYTTMRPVVNANFGDVRESADVNAIMEVLENAVAGAYASSLARG